MAKHLVLFGKPERVMIGREKQIASDDTVRVSKCGRFEIRSRHYSSGRNGHFNTVAYKLTDRTTGAVTEHDTVADARWEANTIIDENWEP